MSNKNIRYVECKSPQQRDRLMAEYQGLGYHVKVEGSRLVVNSKFPPPPKEKKRGRRVDRNRD